MAGKTFKSTAYKRAIDVGKISTADALDLVKIWRTSTGDEKAISLLDLAGGITADYVPLTRTININGNVQDLSADRTWTVSAVSGGNAVSYYLNGGTAASVGTYYEMSQIPVIGTGVDFSTAGNGVLSQFLTGVSDPNRLEILAGNWNFEMWLSSSSSGGVAKFYVELLKYDGVSFTSIASSILTPELITDGTVITLYLTALAVPATTLTVTDRLAVRVYIVDNSGGRTITLHTQDSHLCEVITNFASGISALNGLTQNTQYLAVGTAGTDFNIVSSIATHTFNLPTASSLNRGALSSTDWSTFNGKLNLTSLLTGYVVGANTAIDSSNTILTAFQQVQGQINARVSGTIASGQVAFGTGVNTVGGDSGLTWNNTLKILSVTDGNGTINYRGNSIQFLRNSDNYITANGASAQLYLEVGGAWRWRILATGNLGSNGAQTIQTSTGNLTLATGGANGNILLTPNGTGLVMVGTGTPTNTLDVNGTARIRTISNGVGDFLTKDAVGVVTARTAAEVRTDIGAFPSASLSIASGQVAFGTGVNTVGGDSSIIWNNVNKNLTISNSAQVGLTVTSTSTECRIIVENNTTTPNAGFQFNANSVRKWVLAAFGTGFNWTLFNNSLNQTSIYVLSSNHNVGLGANNTSPTNTLDVNGTARIRTISNGVGDFLTKDAVGVVTARTAAQTLTDIGGLSSYSLSIALGQVAFGTGVNTVGGDSGLVWDNVTKRLSVGSASLTAKLNVADGASGASVVSIANELWVHSSGDSGMTISSPNANYSRLYFGSPADASGSILEYFYNGGSPIFKLGTVTLNASLVFVSGDSVERARFLSTGEFGLNTTSPTNTLDVNGTARIRTISNGTGDFLTKDAVGVITARTAAQTLTDIGAEASFLKGSLVQGVGVSLIGTLSNRLIGTGDVTVSVDGQVPIRQVFVYSVTNAFSLSYSNPTAIYVSLNGQVLEQGGLYDWTISGTTLTVTTPLRAGDEISILYYTSLPSVTSYGRNIDGGAPDSVYLAIQNVDGGTP